MVDTWVPRIDSPQNRLRDDAITLAPPELEDAATVLECDADSDIQHWYDWPLTPPADDPQTYAARLAAAEQTVRNQRASWDNGEQFTFVIRSAAAGVGLGWVDLQPRGSGRGNIAYGVIARHRRKGAATRAVLLAVSYAFDVLGWMRLDLATVADNVASRAVALKSGFRLEGVMRSYGAYERYQPLIGKRFDWAIHGLLSTDSRG